jgi:hypothetical protein
MYSITKQMSLTLQKSSLLNITHKPNSSIYPTQFSPRHILHLYNRQGPCTFLKATRTRTALGTTQPPTQWLTGDLSLEVKRPGREADHSPPSSAEVKECVELYLHSPNMPSWRGDQLKNSDNCTFYLYSTPKVSLPVVLLTVIPT